MTRRLLLATTSLVLLVACGREASGEGSGDAGGAPPSSEAAGPAPSTGCDGEPAPPVPRGEPTRVDMVVGDDDRWFTLLIPTSTSTAPVPLVIDLHGYLSGSEVQAAISDFGATADAEGFVLATPQGSGTLPYWNAVPHDELPDDVAFVEEVIEEVSASTCIDLRRVYVDGFSNGAFLTSLVACHLADRVAAVAAVAGLQLPADCTPARPVPVLGIHGTADRHVSATGGPNPALDGLQWDEQSRLAFTGLPFADVTDTAAGWAELQGCDRPPATTQLGDVEHVAYRDCEGDGAVELYLVDGGGHTWPGSAFTTASEALLGPTTEEIDATETIWTFFADHPMP